MSDEITTQEVTITITEGDKSAIFRITREESWPGAKPRHIAHLIDEVALQAKNAIFTAEGKKPEPGPYAPGTR